MNSFIEAIYKLSNIKRFSSHRVNHVQDPAQHSFNVALLALYIVDSTPRLSAIKIDREQLLLKALFHDLPEAYMGDIPAPTKYYNTEIHKAIKKVEKSISIQLFADSPFPDYYERMTATAKEGADGEIIQLADILDRCIYLTLETRSGNTLAEDMYNDTKKQLQSPKYQGILERYPIAKEILKQYGEHLNDV